MAATLPADQNIIWTPDGAVIVNALVTIPDYPIVLALSETKGDRGSAGPQGPPGSQGIPGQGYTWRGAWSSASSYAAYDTVSYQGSSYVCIAGNSNQVPTNPAYWNIIAQMGATGATGATGAQGPPGNTGATGTAATIAVGTTSTLVPGSPATVNNSGSSAAAVFNFGIPQGIAGPVGATGATGAQGPIGNTGAPGQGYTWRGAWVNTTGYNPYDTVSYQGSSYVAIATNTGQTPPNATYWNIIAQMGATGATGATGAQGPPGNTGATGTAATIAVGTTSTLVPGSPATVNNSGSSSAAVFNFGIPAGQTGATGAQGPIGNTGAVGPAGQGYTWRGAWSSTTAYNPYDTVSSAGSSYVAIAANTNQAPPNATYWNLIAQIGATGAQGPQGPAGGTNVSADAGNVAKLGTDNFVYVAPVPPGVVWEYAGASLPAGGWLWANGASYPTATYPNLFNAIGYTYGGSGANFNVPDRRGRAGIGAGQGTGLTNRTLGTNGGEENHQLVTAELASHTHIQNPHQHYNGSTGGQGTASGGGYMINGSGAVQWGVMATTAVNQNTGSDTAHNTMMPFLVSNYIIKT